MAYGFTNYWNFQPFMNWLNPFSKSNYRNNSESFDSIWNNPWKGQYQNNFNNIYAEHNIFGNNRSNSLHGSNRNHIENNIYGKGGNDVLRGGNGNYSQNDIYGGRGNDKLYGGNGWGTVNRLDGGKGNDKLVGGGAHTANIFDPGSGKNTIKTNGGRNYIDLSHGDNKYGRNNIDARSGKSTIDLTNYQGSGTTIRANGDDTIYYDKDKGLGNVRVRGNARLVAVA